MKKQLLSLGIIALSSFSLNAQCGPGYIGVQAMNDTLAARGTTWGAVPDTTQNLPLAASGQLYSGVLSFKFPSNAQEVDPQQPNVNIEEIRVKDVIGLPPGMTFISAASTIDDVFCDGSAGPDVDGCHWNGGAHGCALLEGTPGATGTYELTIVLEGKVQVVGWQDIDLNGYKIVVEPADLSELNDDAFKVNQNSPNPFNGTTKILYEMEKASTVDFKVINLLGEVVYKNTYEANSGINNIIFDGSDLNEGVYMYTLAVGAKKVTKRMVISK